MVSDDKDGTPLPVSVVPVLPSGIPHNLPRILADTGPAAHFAWDEFFAARIRNHHTRALYRRAVCRFLRWVEERNTPLIQVTPGMVGGYFDEHPGAVSTRKAELAALRKFFDLLVTRHVLVLNPAASVKGERYHVVEGLTPEITAAQARHLLASIQTNTMAGLRDRAVIGILIYTAARAGAVANLKIKHLQHDGSQHTLRFAEKGGKTRLIPLRHDLQQYVLAYLHAAFLDKSPENAPLFRTVAGRTDRLTGNPLTGVDICRMMKRRLKAAGLPQRLSPHSFRVCTVTDLLSQGVPLEDVQYLAGHADPRTTRLYDRRQRKVTRNIVERISI